MTSFKILSLFFFWCDLIMFPCLLDLCLVSDITEQFPEKGQ